MGVAEQFEAVKGQADPNDVWTFQRCQAAIDALDAGLPTGWNTIDEETGEPVVPLTPEVQSIIKERAAQLAIQYVLLEKTVVPLNGDVIAAAAYAQFEAENPPPSTDPEPSPTL